MSTSCYTVYNCEHIPTNSLSLKHSTLCQQVVTQYTTANTSQRCCKQCNDQKEESLILFTNANSRMFEKNIAISHMIKIYLVFSVGTGRVSAHLVTSTKKILYSNFYCIFTYITLFPVNKLMIIIIM